MSHRIVVVEWIKLTRTYFCRCCCLAPATTMTDESSRKFNLICTPNRHTHTHAFITYKFYKINGLGDDVVDRSIDWPRKRKRKISGKIGESEAFKCTRSSSVLMRVFVVVVDDRRVLNVKRMQIDEFQCCLFNKTKK